jgi:transposase InsO family protein
MRSPNGRSRALVERKSDYLVPVLEDLLTQYPFVIRGFHSDNGSEFINQVVAKLQGKLLIEFTKSRARRTNDQALVEGKNGSIVRKQMGYLHIPGSEAEKIQRFYKETLNVYLNFHRPCGFATEVVGKLGKCASAMTPISGHLRSSRACPRPTDSSNLG